jgi:hypothetical protein
LIGNLAHNQSFSAFYQSCSNRKAILTSRLSGEYDSTFTSIVSSSTGTMPALVKRMNLMGGNAVWQLKGGKEVCHAGCLFTISNFFVPFEYFL